MESMPHENGLHAKHDDVESSAAISSEELRKKKRLKCFAYIVAFVLFQTGIIALFALTIMKIRTPKFRVQSATFESFAIGTAANPSFHMRMNAQLGLKNTNFGGYKYQNTTLNFYYNGSSAGEALVPSSEVGWRTTKKINVLVDLSWENSQLGNDLTSGVLTLNSQAILNGKVELFKFLFKKWKSINLDCIITVGLRDKVVRQISCR